MGYNINIDLFQKQDVKMWVGLIEIMEQNGQVHPLPEFLL